MKTPILIIEEHDELRKLLREWLEVTFPGYRVIAATSSEEAIAIARSWLPRLVVIDIDQLWVSGIEATKEIKDITPEARVVVLGAHDYQPYGDDVLSAGASAYVPKWKMHSELSPTLTRLVRAEERERATPSTIESKSAQKTKKRRRDTRAPSLGGMSMLGGPMTIQKVLVSAMLLALVAFLVRAGLAAFFQDIEESSDNVLAAGTLDLSIDDENPLASAKFSVSNFRPGDERRSVWELCNQGTLDGYLDLQNITITGYENGCIEPESKAGDSTCGNPGQGEGELQELIGMDLFWDYNCDGSFDSDEKKIYRRSEGPAGGIASSYDENEPLKAGQCICMAAYFKWSSDSYGDDDLGQGDSMELDLTFELGQETGQ